MKCADVCKQMPTFTLRLILILASHFLLKVGSSDLEVRKDDAALLGENSKFWKKVEEKKSTSSGIEPASFRLVA
jgi:hypothetical protein